MFLWLLLASVLFYDGYVVAGIYDQNRHCVCKGSQTLGKNKICLKGNCQIDPETQHCIGNDYRLYTTPESSSFYCFNPNTTSQTERYDYQGNVARWIFTFMNRYMKLLVYNETRRIAFGDIFHPAFVLKLEDRQIVDKPNAIPPGFHELFFGQHVLGPYHETIYKPDYATFESSLLMNSFSCIIRVISPVLVSETNDYNFTIIRNITQTYKAVIEFDDNIQITNITLKRQQIRLDSLLSNGPNFIPTGDYSILGYLILVVLFISCMACKELGIFKNIGKDNECDCTTDSSSKLLIVETQ